MKISNPLFFIFLFFSCSSEENKKIDSVKKDLEKYTYTFVDKGWNIHYVSFSGNMASYKMKQIDLTPGMDDGYDKVSNQKIPYKVVIDESKNIYIEFYPSQDEKSIYQFIKKESGEIYLEGEVIIHAVQDGFIDKNEKTEYKETKPAPVAADTAW